MRDEPLPLPDDDLTPPPDPFEAELVAYLDGELDTAAARRVEARLARDPAARAKAAALKKTFDLLDYLPRHEPSPTFATRTLERLPTTTPNATQPKPRPVAAQPAVARGSLPVPRLLAGGSPLVVFRRHHRAWWAVGVVFAITAFALAGYLITSVVQPRLLSPTPGRDSVADDLPLSDRGLIEKLPLYAAVDDLEFVQTLAGPDHFGDDPTVAFDAHLKTPAVEPEPLPAPAFEALTKAFKALPPARQQAVRELDRQLNAQDAATRDRLTRVLEAYAIWLDRLPESERRGVLAAATPLLRLGVIRDIREHQWLNALPAAQKATLTGLDPAARGEKIRLWKEEEARRRDVWTFARKHADTFVTNRQPWPFDSEAARKDVPEFIRVAFKTDDPRGCRFTPPELAQYREALEAAQKSNEWAWYGKAVYELTRRHEVLPEPAVGEPITDYSQLKAAAQFFQRSTRAQKTTLVYQGKWPEFALAVHNFAAAEKGDKLPPLPPLGPAKVADFKEPVREFWEKELSPKLTQAERNHLRSLEGRWPEYPREFVQLARQHDLSVPGVMLPGMLRKWEAIYGGGGVRLPGRQ